MIRVADYIIQRLIEEGIHHIPLITGRGLLYLSDAVAKNDEIKPILMHNEQAASYAGVAYAQYNDKLGACMVSTGCASTNALTGVLNAWQDGVPMIYISGQNKLQETVAYTGKNIRSWGSQEANIIPIVQSITKYSTIITDAKSIGEVMDTAIYFATHGVKGPVWIDIPVDVQNMRVEPSELKRWSMKAETLTPTHDELEFVIEEWNKAERPTVLIGNGIRASHAIDVLSTFVEKLSIPVTFSASAVDVYGLENELSLGTVGTIGGTRCGNFTIQNADLVLSIGCRLSPLLTGSQYEKFAREAKLIVVDIDKEEHSKGTVRIDRFILSDAKVFIEALQKMNLKPASKEWVDKCTHWKSIFPKCELGFKSKSLVDLYDFASHLSNHLNDDAVLLTDAGLEEVIVPSVVSFKKGQRCLHPASQGCMGVALPAAIGAYYSCGHDVVAVIGDGSIMMNLQELQTISAYHIPVKIIVVNNNAYSVIRTRQVELFRSRTIGTDPSNGVILPNFRDVADCFRIPYIKAGTIMELDDTLNDLFAIDGPVLCEVMAVENQDYIRNGAGFNAQRRFVMRPIEDQMPFMDRELFKKEMIVKPIDI